jgi:hypothetical protein
VIYQSPINLIFIELIGGVEAERVVFSLLVVL